MTLQPHELKLAAKLLEIAPRQFSSHGCNDFDLVSDAGLTIEQAYAINRACVERNGDVDEWEDEEIQVSHAVFGDSGLMRFLAAKLQEESES